jgi:DNA-directed RNA polymerase subunit M/transcription elongation factor TFIIS
MSRISKFFEKDYDSDKDSSSEEESDVEEEIDYDSNHMEDEVYNESDDTDEDILEEEEEKVVKKKEKKKVNNVVVKTINDKLRKNTKLLLKKLFQKYNIGVKKTDEKINEIENIIYTKSNNNYSCYLENARKISSSCAHMTLLQLKSLLDADYFSTDFFEKERKTNEKNISNITCRLEPMSGIHKCKCGCDKVYSYELQTRSADEGMTLFLQCYDCGKKWKM